MAARYDNAGFQSCGATPERAPGPIGGPGAWRGRELARQPPARYLATTEVKIKVLHKAVGSVNESDVQLASAQRSWNDHGDAQAQSIDAAQGTAIGEQLVRLAAVRINN